MIATARYDDDGKRIGYKVSEVARLLGVSRQLIYRLIARNELPAVAFTPSLLIVRSRDLKRFMDDRVA